MLIKDREIGTTHPCFIVAEMSANHQQRFGVAVELVKQAKAAGADAVKVQLYTPGTMTLPVETGDFFIKSGLWRDTSLWNLYSHTCMPWEWYPDLLALAEDIGVMLFPTVYDLTSLEFAEKYATPAYKIASFEVGDRRLLRAVAEVGKPTLISTGFATEDDIRFVNGLFDRYRCPVGFLYCVSDYPAEPTEDAFEALNSGDYDGVSDHTVGIGFPILCVLNGACIIEKHFWNGKGDCADREFSLAPAEFGAMVSAIRAIEDIAAHIVGGAYPKREAKEYFQRSIYVARDVKKGQIITADDIRVVRPGYGLDPRKYDDVVGAVAVLDMPLGTALKENYYRKGNEGATETI